MLIRKILGIFILFTVVLCSAPSLQARDSAGSEDILTQANAFAQSGDTSRALSLLRQFVLEYPDAAQTPAAYAQLSRILLQEERPEQARLYAARIPASRRPDDLTLLLAQEYMAKEDFARSQEMLAQLREENLSQVQQLDYLQLQADIALQRGELMQALVYCDQILQNPKADEGKLTLASRSAYEVIFQMDPMAREESAFMFEGTPVAFLVQLYHLEEQEPTRVEPGSEMQGEGEELARSAKIAWIRQRALTWLDQVEGRSWHQHALGVVLPLSGRYAPFGRMVKQGIELALAQQTGTNIELIVRDSRADVAHTEAVMRDLLETQRVLAVLGPMMGKPATRAAEMAQEYRVPIILLSHWEGLPQLGSYVFRHSLTAKQQAQALADYAVQILGMKTFALLQPENKLGDNFTRLFSSALKQEGAEVLYHRSYSPGSTDFRAALKPMAPPEEEDEQEDEQAQAQMQAAEGDQEMKAAEEKAEPELEFDALFIPDFADTIGLLAPSSHFPISKGRNYWELTDGIPPICSIRRDAMCAAQCLPMVLIPTPAISLYRSLSPSIFSAMGSCPRSLQHRPTMLQICLSRYCRTRA